MKKRGISLLLCLLLLASLTAPTFAAEGESPSNTSGIVVNKTAVDNGNGGYTITLEAYATGEKVITTTQTEIPTDIVLVLDQSGSMTDDMGQYSFQPYTGDDAQNQNLYPHRVNNGGNGDKNLWYVENSGAYAVQVNVEREQLAATYEPYANETNTTYNNNQSELYYLDGNTYRKISVAWEIIWEGWNSYIRYTYTYADAVGGTLGVSDGVYEVPEFASGFYKRVPGQNQYTYTYFDSSNNPQSIISTGDTTRMTDPTLYKGTFNPNGGGTRLEALKGAVTRFAGAVNEKAKGADGAYGGGDDVNHRIAVVGFASGGNKGEYNDNRYENTEVFVGSNQYRYGTNAQGKYSSAFQDMSTIAGKNNIDASIAALAAYGGTFTNLGLEMANGIFAANPLPTNETRNRVVIVFTDGMPGTGAFNSDVADLALGQASTAKNTYGATVYAVGIFFGADATSAGSENGNDTDKANRFMQKLSSNNGRPPAQNEPSYYLSAGDAASLNSIFQQIANQVEEGGSSTTLDSNAVIEDIVAPSFTLAPGTTAGNITLKTYRCTGRNDGVYTWAENPGAMGANAGVEGDVVSVTGFNFSENWVGTSTENGTESYHGHKLQISFDVVPKTGFLGGNDVPTNTSAVVYESSTAQNPVAVFPVPKVNVPIPEVQVADVEKNVYLLGSLSAEDLCGEVTVGDDVTLDMSQPNYGLEAWQNDYVDIDVSNPETLPEALTEDISGTTTVTVSPKYEAATGENVGDPAAKQSDSGNVTVNVFKPEKGYQDITKWLDETVLTSDINGENAGDINKSPVVWKHGETVASSGIMTGEAPDVSFTYSIDGEELTETGYRITDTEDIPVNASAKITKTNENNQSVSINIDQHITYTWSRESCPSNETAIDDHDGEGTEEEFRVHVKTGTLKIIKAGGRTDEGFVFKVTKLEDTSFEMRVSCLGQGGSVTIAKLPKGTYTVTEETGYGGAWRYDKRYETGTITDTTPNAVVTITNSEPTAYMLDGWSFAANNSVSSGSGQ